MTPIPWTSTYPSWILSPSHLTFKFFSFPCPLLVPVPCSLYFNFLGFSAAFLCPPDILPWSLCPHLLVYSPGFPLNSYLPHTYFPICSLLVYTLPCLLLAIPSFLFPISPGLSAKFEFRYESLKSKFSFILLACNLIIGCSKKN